jgi:hypothetical protein
MSLSFLCPAIIPPNVGKVLNIGDGFIDHCIENSFKAFSSEEPILRFTTRTALTSADVEKINSTKALIVCGTNLYGPNFKLNFSMNDVKIPVIPISVGWTGIGNRKNFSFTAEAKRLLQEIHERIPASSVRCLHSKQLLDTVLPEDKTIHTGCAVSYFDYIFGKNETPEEKILVISITNRGDQASSEMQRLKDIHDTFKGKYKIYISLNQNLGNHNILKQYGTIISSNNIHDYFSIYDKAEMHIGSRLHTHLYFLARKKKSYLLTFDGRQEGFAHSLDFNLYKSPKDIKYDTNFEAIYNKIDSYFNSYKSFIQNIK